MISVDISLVISVGISLVISVDIKHHVYKCNKTLTTLPTQAMFSV